VRSSNARGACEAAAGAVEGDTPPEKRIPPATAGGGGGGGAVATAGVTGAEIWVNTTGAPAACEAIKAFADSVPSALQAGQFTR
jgi:hypothetical protein